MVEPETGRPVGYLLAKDLIAEGSADADWTPLVRLLCAVRPEDDIESTLMQLQQEGATVCVVQDADSPVGLITIEDILEQVVGRIEDEYPRDFETFPSRCCLGGRRRTRVRGPDAGAGHHRTRGGDPGRQTASGCEDRRLGAGPRARRIHRSRRWRGDSPCPLPNLRSPLVVIGRSPDEIVFSPHPAEPVRLIFLLVMPAEKPDVQVFLLGQLARCRPRIFA